MSESSVNFVFSSDIPLKTLPLSKEQLIFRYVFAVISFAVNFFVILVVACSKQLHLPRHTFWAGTSLIIVFITVQWLVELFTDPETNLAACVILELSIGTWYPALLLFLSLAGLDRYVAIKHYEWYKRSASNKRAIVLMLVTWTLNAVVTNLPYWTGYKSLDKCTVNQTHVFLLFTWNVVLGLVNITLQAKIFIESKRAIREYASSWTGVQSLQRYMFREPQVFSVSIELRCYGTNNQRDLHLDHELRVTNGISSENRQEQPSEFNRTSRLDVVPHLTTLFEPPSQSFSVQCFPWASKAQRHRRTVNERLDFRAALILSANVVPFWICTFPMAFYVMALYWCSRLQLDCSYGTLMQADAYVKFLFFAQCIYMPVMFMWNSGEFQRALKHLFKKIETRASSANHTCNRPMN